MTTSGRGQTPDVWCRCDWHRLPHHKELCAEEGRRQTPTRAAYVPAPLQRPPWVLVIQLPEDVPPLAVDLSSLPQGCEVTAFCSEAGERVLAAAADAVLAATRCSASIPTPGGLAVECGLTLPCPVHPASASGGSSASDDASGANR